MVEGSRAHGQPDVPSAAGSERNCDEAHRKVMIIVNVNQAGADCESQLIERFVPHPNMRAIHLPDGAAPTGDLTEEQIQPILDD